MAHFIEGARLRTARVRAGLTLNDIAARVGISVAMLSLVELGQCNLNPSLLERLKTELGLDGDFVNRVRKDLHAAQ